MASSSAPMKPTVGILSIGDMGMGVAKLLLAHDYPVCTVSQGRSQHTRERIQNASIVDLQSDEDLVVECDIILSIVPPRDATAIARRIHEACKKSALKRNEKKGFGNLLYIDLNAISPRTSKRIGAYFAGTENAAAPSESIARRLSRSFSAKVSAPSPAEVKPIVIRYLDGGIIGGPPAMKDDGAWKKPSIVISGPKLDLVAQELTETLNMRIVSDEIGTASTLKACFASLTKGFYAIAITSFTTAQTAGVLPELQEHIQQFFPSIYAFLEKGLPNIPPKAYRWVDEMKHIGDTFSDQGRFLPSHEGQAIFDGVSEIYQLMADETILGKEITGKRKRGTTLEDVATCMREGIEAKRAKRPDDENAEMAWKGSWQ